MALLPAYPVDASATARGLLNTTTQILAGLKTFTGGLVATLPTAGASDVAAKFGTTVADGSVHDQAQLLTVATGIGGTQKDIMVVRRPSVYGRAIVTLDQQNTTNTIGLEIKGGPAGVGGLQLSSATGGYAQLRTGSSGSPVALYVENKGLLFMQNASGYDQTMLMKFLVYTTSGVASTIPAFDFESTASLQSGQALTRWKVNGSEVARIQRDGALELKTAGVGIVLASPDGTRYRLTVSNAGELVIAAA